MGREVHLQGVGKMVRARPRVCEDKVVIQIPIKASKENIIECERHGVQPGVVNANLDAFCIECYKDWIQEIAAESIKRELSLGVGNAINCVIKKPS